jgi:hypothetical protein
MMKGAKKSRRRLFGLSFGTCKKRNKVETFDFTQFDDMGEPLKEITRDGADKVIDRVKWTEKNLFLRQTNRNSNCKEYACLHSNRNKSCS